MTPELTLLRGLMDKERYEIYRPFIDEDIFVSPEHKRILEVIDEEHNRTGETLVLPNVFTALVPDYDRLPALGGIVREFAAYDGVDGAVLDTVFENIKQRNLAAKIALKAVAVSEGRESYDDLVEFVDQHKSTKAVSVDDVNILNMDIRTYKQEKDGEDCIHWRLNWLNKSLGPLRKGNLGHLFANPEVGKTAFWISEVTHMIQHTDRKIVIFFNEEDGLEIIYRMYSSMLGVPYKQIIEDIDRYAPQFLDLGGNRIIFVDQAPLRFGFMERVMAKHQPCFCVIDNADKISTRNLERRDLEIHSIYKWARELAKEYCPILTVAHADASAYGEKYLTESMMANSKVGKPAEMDFIIGLGQEEGEEVARYISLPKNKLRGDKNTVEQLRHGKWPIALQSEISRFVDSASEA